jgi:hypothetical protein
MASQSHMSPNSGNFRTPEWLLWIVKSRISKIGLGLLIEPLWISTSHGIMWHTKPKSIVEKNNVVSRVLFFFGSRMFSYYSLYDKALWAQTKKKEFGQQLPQSLIPKI